MIELPPGVLSALFATLLAVAQYRRMKKAY